MHVQPGALQSHDATLKHRPLRTHRQTCSPLLYEMHAGATTVRGVWRVTLSVSGVVSLWALACGQQLGSVISKAAPTCMAIPKLDVSSMRLGGSRMLTPMRILAVWEVHYC